MLLGPAYVTVTNVFAPVYPLPTSDRDKDAEIIVLRHQITVPQHRLGKEKARVHPDDRALLAALLHRLPVEVLRRVRLLVRPDTVLRRHRGPVARRRSAAPAETPGKTADSAIHSAPGAATRTGDTRDTGLRDLPLHDTEQNQI